MASGNTLITLDAAAAHLPSSNYARWGARNSQPTLKFADTTADQTAYFRAVMPRHYGGAGITVYLHYSMATATTGKVRWDVAFERIGDGSQDIDSNGFASAQTVNVAAVDGTSGNVDIASVAFTNGAQMDSVAVGETFRISVTRVQSDGTNDTATGDAELIAIELKET